MATSRGQSSFVRAGWRMPWRRLLVALAAVPATVVGLGSLTPAYAQSTLFVAEGGTDGTNACTNSADPCATITHALTVASAGDTIEVSGTIVDRNIAPSAALNPITIAQDPNGSPAVINADGSGRVFNIATNGVNLTLDHLTLENGAISGNGGAILINAASTVSVDHSTIAGNRATGNGGGITVTGLFGAAGALTVANSTFVDNTAGLGGGAIFNTLTTTIVNSTFFGNSTGGTGLGGAINNNVGTMAIFGSTITGNSTTGTGSGGGIRSSNTFLAIGASIVSGNTTLNQGPNCQGVMPVSLGYNLTDDTVPTGGTATACGFSPSTKDVVGADPMLGGLANNGGPTETLLPAESSPAVGMIPDPTTLTPPANFGLPPVTVCGNGATDQRGMPRPSPGTTACTIGAVEVAPPFAIATTSLAPGNLGHTYEATLEASGRTPPLTWAVTAGALPPGLTLNPETGAISGAPELLGTSTFTVAVTDSAGETATKELSIEVGPTAVAAVGTDGAMWVQTPQEPSGWNSLGGQLIAAPAVAAVPDGSGLASPLFVATGTDHNLWVRSLSEDWTELAPGVFTVCVGSPAAVVTEGTSGPELTVACQGGDHHMYTATVPVVSGELPVVTEWTNLLGALAAGPAVAPVDGVITYWVTASFNHGQVWTRTAASSDWGPTPFFCIGSPAAGIAPGGTTTWFGCQLLDGQMWAGPSPGGVAPRGGAINPGPGLGISSLDDYMFAEARFGDRSVWFLTPGASDWLSLGGSVSATSGGVGAVGLS